MNLRCQALTLLLACGVCAAAQDPAVDPAVGAAPRDYAQRTSAELDQLLGPIALYPDALIAMILPAATAPADIVLAARYLKDSNNGLAQVENRAWDESVKSLTHYPEVLQWMDENLAWTKQVGEAFEEEPAAVMDSIQRLRVEARDAGTLFTTPQQLVLADPDGIRIVPAQPDFIYVPRYQPDIVYLPQPAYYPPLMNYYPYSNSMLTFGAGLPVGSWLAFEFDWRQRTIWVGDRHRRWRGHDWQRPLVPIPRGFVSTPTVHQWRPPPRPSRPTLAATPRYTPEAGRLPATTIRPTHPYLPRASLAESQPTATAAPRGGDLNTRSRGTVNVREYAIPRVMPAAGSDRATPPTAQFVTVPVPVSAAPLVRNGNAEGKRDRSAGPRNSSNPTVVIVPQRGAAPATMPGQAAPSQPAGGHRGTWQPAPAPAVTRPVATQNPSPPPVPAASPPAARQAPPAQTDDRRPRN